MRAILQVLTGPRPGRTVEVRPGEPMLVGRLPECGLCITSDPTVSRRHCQLELDGTACRVVNLSANGTLVNGRRVDELRLRNGDEIEIGAATVLRVVLKEGEFARETSLPAGATIPSTAPTQARFDVPPSYQTSTCRSGLIEYVSISAEPKICSIVQALSGVRPLYLIVDYGKLKQSGKPPEPAYLFDFLPAATRDQFSPVILSAAQHVNWPAVLDEAWGQDAVITLFSEEDAESVLQQLRKAAGAWARPSVVVPQLCESSKEFVDSLLEGIDAVLTESNSLGRWSLYASPNWDTVLQSAGFVSEASESPTEARPSTH